MIAAVFKRMRYKHKLSLSYMTVVVVPILVLGMYSYNQSRQLLQEQARHNLEAYADKIAGSIEDKLDRYASVIRYVAFNTRIQQVLGNHYDNFGDLTVDYIDVLQPFFSNVTAMNKELQQITIFTTTELPQFGTLIQPIEYAEDTYWYADANAGSGILWFYDNGELAAVQKIIDFSSNRVLGFLFMKLDHNAILDHSLVMEVQQYGIMITNKRNEIVYSKEVTGSTASPFRLVNADTNVLVPGHEDQYITSAKPLSQAGLTFTYFVPIDGINREIGSILKAALAIAIVCLLVVGVFISIYSRTFVRRIHGLVENMKKAEKGDFNRSIGSDYADEVGQLTNQFGKMVRRLDELIKDGYEKEIAKKEAELRALQSQINPHFLYNSLSVMNWKAVRMGAEDISYVATRLSRFYRAVLNRGENVITVREELENTKTYIELQLMVHRNRFDVEYRIDDSIAHFVTLNMILQPVVENAIEHGIGHMREGRGMLTITGAECDDCIEITVADNGPGMKEETLEKLRMEQYPGYGLRNVQERIRLFCGERYGLLIRSGQGSGTAVTLCLPKSVAAMAKPDESQPFLSEFRRAKVQE